MIDNIKSSNTAPTIFLLSISNNQSFVSVPYMLSALPYKNAESLLLICLQWNNIVSGQKTFFPKVY
jgi:hypothetical protein